MSEPHSTPSANPLNGAARPATTGLAGKRVVVTRAVHQAAEMIDLLQERDAIPLRYPCLAISPPADTRLLDDALNDAANGKFDRLVLTSANTVHILAQRLSTLALALGPLPTAAVGPKTAAAAATLLGLNVTLVAKEHVAESLAQEMSPAPGERLLLPQSAIARPVLAERLRAAGAQVTVVDAYHTGIGQGGEPVPALLAEGQIDIIPFTSSSTVTNFLERLQREGGQRRHLTGVCLAAIGPVTADTMAEAGLPVDVMPAEYTLQGLLTALESHFSR